MSVYSELIDEMGFDPFAPAPEIPAWVPWTLRGTWEVILGRSDLTVYTRDNAKQLNRLLDDITDTQAIELPEDLGKVAGK